MKLEALIPFNNQIIRTCIIKDLGYTTNDINKLVEDNILERTRRGYYKVIIKSDADIDLMYYYLNNNMLDEYIQYYNNISIKDFDVYYTNFMYNIIIEDYIESYKILIKCCELNQNYDNRLNLYAYILLLGELMSLSEKKMTMLKNKIIKGNSIESFVECLVKRDYEGACYSLRNTKTKLSKLEVQVFHNLSEKAEEIYKKKSSPVLKDLNRFIDTFNEFILNDDYNGAMYYFEKAYDIKNNNDIDSIYLDTINKLFGCYNFIIENQDISIDTYQTNYKYKNNDTSDFYKSIKNNDFLNSLSIINKLFESEPTNVSYNVFKKLLERIYNFLNIRFIIKNRNPFQTELSLNDFVKRKEYAKALNYTRNSDMDGLYKKIISSIIESIESVDNIDKINKESD